MKNKLGLPSCTFKDIVIKTILIGSKEGRRFRQHCNKVQGLELLSTTIKILNDLDIKYYLDFGTLIGAVREKGFIEWDDDIDISLVDEINAQTVEKIKLSFQKHTSFYISSISFARSIENRRKKALKDKSIEIYVSNIDFTNEYNTRIIKVRHKSIIEKFAVRILNFLGQNRKGGKCLDIFLKYNHENQLVWMAQNKIHQINQKQLSDEWVEINFYDIKCKIPKNYDEYLTSMYGDWKTPKKDWQYYNENTVTRVS